MSQSISLYKQLANHKLFNKTINFDLKRIKNIFENLSALNMWEIEKLKKEYKFLGYNTAVLDGYKHKLYSFPIYLTLMACIAAILMLNIKHNKSKICKQTINFAF